MSDTSKIRAVAICFIGMTCLPTLALAEEDTDTAGAPAHIVIHPIYQEHNTLPVDIGSSKYAFSNASIANLPQGDSTPLDDLLLHAPGVAQDSYGQLHIRGDHADLQYRINGIILPEGITGFGQTLDTHFANKIDLLTGALPAQYGYRTAGIVDITTKTGGLGNGGESSVKAGSFGTLEGNQEFYGTSGKTDYFFTGNVAQSDRGLEPPTAGGHALHDSTAQNKQFGYMSYAFSPEHRLSVMVGNSTNRFEIPNNPGQPQNFALAGVPDFASSNLDERQYEHNTYAIAALNGALSDDADYQFAIFSRYSSVLFKPDPEGDLIYNGIASRDYRESVTSGIQNDFSYRLGNAHTLRSGWTFSFEQAKSDGLSQVFPCCDISGAQTSDIPFTITDNTSKAARLLGLYLQDEWKATDKLTINYGARFDAYSAFVHETQLSPRIGAVYEVTPRTTLHAGYARYFTPPPTELIAPVSIARFNGTTGQLPTTESSPVLPEKDDYFDAGIIQKFGSHLTLGVDTYFKRVHDLLDEGQFGQALIFAPFNYEKGWIRGIEFTGDYNHGPFSSYANLAFSKAMGKQVASGQFNFDQEELDYIAGNAVHLDHDQLISGSAGAAYTFRDVKYSADVIFGSGLRSGDNNTDHLPFYSQITIGAEHTFDLGPHIGLLDARMSVVNLLDKSYAIRDGSGIGVFAPQFGPRRGVYFVLSKPF